VCPDHEQLAIYLLEQFPAVNQMMIPGQGDQLLHFACGRDALESILQALLKAWLEGMSMRSIHWPNDCKDNKFPREPNLPLHLACCFSQSLKTSQLLCKHGPCHYMNIIATK